MTCPFLSKPKNSGSKSLGSCPFLNEGTSKPIPLSDLEPGFNIPFISEMAILFEAPLVQKYPYYFCHSLRIPNEETIKKARTREIAERYFVWGDFRDAGNEKYHMRNYYDAISLHEQALACLKWLEPVKKLEKDQEKPENFETFENDQNDQKNKNNSEEEDEEIDYYLQSYSLENVLLKSDDFTNNDSDRELRDSMLLMTFLNLSSCYLKLHHYKEALKALKNAEEVVTVSSQILYRKSQAMSYNKCSSLSELGEAKKMINDALKVVKGEKIFQEKFKGLLQRLELDQVEGQYSKQYEFVLKREEQILAMEKKFCEYLLANEKRILIREKEYGLKEERKWGMMEMTRGVNMEEDLMRGMIRKLRGIMQFYVEKRDYGEIEKVRGELMRMKEIKRNMEGYAKILKGQMIKEMGKEFGVDVEQERIRKDLERIAKEKSAKVFNKHKYNKEVFQPTLDEFLSRQMQSEAEENVHELQSLPSKKFDFLPIFLSLILVLIFSLFFALKT